MPRSSPRRVSSSSNCCIRSRIAVICTFVVSSPVASLRYRAMNGTVEPSSSSTAVATTCRGLRFSSWVIWRRCFSFIRKGSTANQPANSKSIAMRENEHIRSDLPVSGAAAPFCAPPQPLQFLHNFPLSLHIHFTCVPVMFPPMMKQLLAIALPLLVINGSLPDTPARAEDPVALSLIMESLHRRRSKQGL